MTDRENIRAALACIPADDRELWLRVGMALQSELPDDDGLALFDEWSQRGATYDARAVRDTWRSFKPGRITIGTLWHEAKARGFKPDRPAPHETPEERQRRERDRAQRRAAEEACYRARADVAARDALALWNGGQEARLLIVGDDDRDTEARTGKNPGRVEARAAARTAQGAAVFPEGLAAGGSDFNDLAQHAGLDAVRTLIEAAVAAPPAVPSQTPARKPDKGRPFDCTQRLPGLGPTRCYRIKACSAAPRGRRGGRMAVLFSRCGCAVKRTPRAKRWPRSLMAWTLAHVGGSNCRQRCQSPARCIQSRLMTRRASIHAGLRLIGRVDASVTSRKRKCLCASAWKAEG